MIEGGREGSDRVMEGGLKYTESGERGSIRV